MLQISERFQSINESKTSVAKEASVLCGHEDQYQQQNELQRAALAVVVQEHCQV